MKLTLLIVMSVIVLTAITSVDAWRRRRFRFRLRRVWAPICSRVCSFKCSSACALCTPVCGTVCGKVCGRKREVKTVGGDGTFIKPMPCNFTSYDVNDDKVITPDELGSLINESGEDNDVKQLFKVMDTDGDGGVTEKEFQAAPLIKDCGGAEKDTKERELDEEGENYEEE